MLFRSLETVEEAGIKEGDKITVKLLEIDPKTGKFKLSHRVLIEKPEGYQERPARERRERPERRDRGERRDHNKERNGERNEHRPRPERGERRERNEEYHEPTNEPKDFTDELDKMDF